MKKIVKLLFVFLLGFMIIPMVHAEDLPTEGVTYFMDYPNGEEEVTLEYNKANNPDEVLIFSGMTDSNGKINLCDWSSTGQLRIVQEVPAGYTTTTKEVKVDLSRDNVASFINYRGLDNPKTGRSILVFLGIIGVVTITILVSRKNKKSLLIIPIIVGVLAVTYVKAETCFCIQVKDGSGKALANVHIDVYAKPNKIEAYPAIVYDADGGEFFDGTDKMYVRIPNSPCTAEEFYGALTEEETRRVQENLALVHKEGYKLTGFKTADSETVPSTLTNGLVLKAVWEADDESNLVGIDGNGGTINFHGKKLNSVLVPTNLLSHIDDNIAAFLSNGNSKLIGFDVTSACNRFNEYGVATTVPEGFSSGEDGPYHRVLGTYYACWATKPDGIYINDEVFIGSPNYCFKNDKMVSDSNDVDSLYFINADSVIYVGDYTLDDIYFNKLKKYDIKSFANNYQDRPPRFNAEYEEEEITKIELIKDGSTIVTLTSEDITLEDGVYYVDNDEKRPILLDYFAILDQKGCFDSH